MKYNSKIPVLVVALILAATTIVSAQYGRGRANYRMAAPGDCYSIPGLTEEQKQKLNTINDAHQKKIDGLRVDRWEAPDFETANAISAKMTSAQTEHLNTVRATLNAEQTEYFNAHVANSPFGQGRGFVQGRGAGYGRGYNQAGYGRGQGYGNVPPGRGRGRGYAARGYGRNSRW
ncbi:MAG: hypothetical protein K8R35_03565 [Bacteroidales bacterium]|nr:hypothetical protein [Bacteroidales bacterium]